MKVPTSAKVRERYVFHLICSMHAPCLHRENFHGFCPQWLPLIFIPQWIYTVSHQREISWIFPSVIFHFHLQWIPCLLKENFHGFYPQWFSFYFKSPTVLSSKGPFILFLRCVSVWTHEHRPTNGFVY